jgi:hypothetical protein
MDEASRFCRVVENGRGWPRLAEDGGLGIYYHCLFRPVRGALGCCAYPPTHEHVKSPLKPPAKRVSHKRDRRKRYQIGGEVLAPQSNGNKFRTPLQDKRLDKWCSQATKNYRAADDLTFI